MNEDLVNVLKEIHNRIGELVALKILELSPNFPAEYIEGAIFGGESENGKITYTDPEKE